LIDTQPHFIFTPPNSSLFVIIYDNPTHHVRKAADLKEKQPYKKNTVSDSAWQVSTEGQNPL